jgi:hypothetical protein
MSQSSIPVNTKLIDSLAQIILSLTEEERQLLEQKIRHQHQSEDEPQRKREALQHDILIGVEQLQNGEYTEYDDSSLPTLLETIKQRGRHKLG